MGGDAFLHPSSSPGGNHGLLFRHRKLEATGLEEDCNRSQHLLEAHVKCMAIFDRALCPERHVVCVHRNIDEVSPPNWGAVEELSQHQVERERAHPTHLGHHRVVILRVSGHPADLRAEYWVAQGKPDVASEAPYHD